MSTRSTITARLSNGTWKSVYCHFDGYPTHNGRILLEHYNTQERVEALLEFGDMSILASRCDKPEGHSYKTPVDDCTVYFGRDRGDDDTLGETGATFEDAFCRGAEEFNYVWDLSRWTVEGLDIAEVLKMKSPDRLSNYE